jgi:hypothetical protein
MSTYDRVKGVLSDGRWHTIEELKEVSYFPERWIEELKRDGLEVAEEADKVALVGAADRE